MCTHTHYRRRIYRRIVPSASPRAAIGDEVSATSFSRPRHMREGASSLPRCLIFPLTACSQCTYHSWVGYGRRWSRNLEPNFCSGRGLNPGPLDWQSSALITRPIVHPLQFTRKSAVSSQNSGLDLRTCKHFLTHLKFIFDTRNSAVHQTNSILTAYLVDSEEVHV